MQYRIINEDEIDDYIYETVTSIMYDEDGSEEQITKHIRENIDCYKCKWEKESDMFSNIEEIIDDMIEWYTLLWLWEVDELVKEYFDKYKDRLCMEWIRDLFKYLIDKKLW